MKYKIRQGESAIKQPHFEYLQNGLIIRYNQEQVKHEENTIWIYTDLWISNQITEEEATDIANNVIPNLIATVEVVTVVLSVVEHQRHSKTFCDIVAQNFLSMPGLTAMDKPFRIVWRKDTKKVVESGEFDEKSATFFNPEIYEGAEYESKTWYDKKIESENLIIEEGV